MQAVLGLSGIMPDLQKKASPSASYTELRYSSLLFVRLRNCRDVPPVN